MTTPTTNKWRASTIYGNLSVRDLTNSAGTTVVEQASVDLSGNFLSRGDSTFTKAVICNGTISNNLHLATKLYVDTAISGGSILGLNNAWTGTNTYNSYFPTSTLPTSTTITTNSIVNKGMNDTLYSSKTNEVKTNTANAFTSTNTFNSNFPTSTLPTSTAITDDSIVNKSMNDTIYAGLAYQNTFTDVNYFNGAITQDNAPRATNLNKFIRTDFQEQISLYSITDVKNSTFDTALRVATGDYPYLPTNSPYTNPQIFTVASQQTVAGSQISINQTTTSATNTANYQLASTIISNFTIPTNFSKNITLNIPISLRNAGTWTLTGSALNATITNTINSMTASIYNSGSLWGTGTITIQNSNSSTRSTTIGYTTTGTKTIALDQYFFNIDIDTSTFFSDTYMIRNNSTTNVVQIVLSMNITNTITKNTNTGNFTATNTLTLVSNTSTSTISNTGTTPTTITYSPNSNGTNYAVATSTSTYNDPALTTGGTTYTNHLRANTFNLLPEGMIIQYTGSTAPSGWLLCDGSIYNASANPVYQALYNVIGNQFGGTTNANFKVPDYRGAFLRGAGTSGVAGYTTYVGQTINTPATHATQTHTHTATQAVHTHSIRFKGNGNSGVQTVGGSILFNPNATSFGSPSSIDIQTGQRLDSGTQFQNVQPAITVDNSTTNVDANETRPFNYSVNYLIKY